MKKLLCIVCALALFTLSGCRLAKADSVDPGAEILVGAFVSLDAIGYPGRDGPVELTKTDDGWQCPGVEGVWVYILPVHEGGGISFEPSGDPRADMGGVRASIGGGVSWSATLRLANTIDEDAALHFNPLYLRQDGSMYAEPSIGLGIDPKLVGRGGSWNSSHESAVPVYDWTEENWSTKVEIYYEVAVPAERYVLCRMDDQNRELSRADYLPGQLPESLVPDCHWLLLECHLTDGRVERQVFGPEDHQITTLFPEETGLCRREVTLLSWAG